MSPDELEQAHMQTMQALDQMGAMLRQIETWAAEHRDRMKAQGWSPEAAEKLAMERVQLMQSIIISSSMGG